MVTHCSRLAGGVLAVIVLAAAAPAQTPDHPAERAAVDSVLTRLHLLASKGDWPAYFDLYRPDAVFLGTDATERWTLEAFRRYAVRTRGWTYASTERHIFIAPDGRTAWFDERLHNVGNGETRGTGVLVHEANGWKFAQYNLTFPVPNELADDLVKRIAALKGK